MSKLFDLCGHGTVTYQNCHTTEECGMSSDWNSVEARGKKASACEGGRTS